MGEFDTHEHFYSIISVTYLISLVALSDASAIVEDFNQQIGAARKYKSASYMASVNMDKLKEPLAKSKQGLEEWLLARVGTKEPSPKYPGVFDDWTGRR